MSQQHSSTDQFGDDDFTGISQRSGVVRYQHNAQGYDLQRGVEPSTNRPGVTRYVHGQEVESSDGVVRYTGGSDDHGAGNIMASVRSPSGSPTHRVTPDCSVEIPGLGRTSVAVAAHIGYMTRTADGSYVATSGAPQPQQQDQQKTQRREEGGDEEFAQAAPEAEADFQALVDPIPQHAFDSATAMASVALRGEDAGDWERVQQRLVQNGGVEPEQAAALIQHAYEHYESIVRSAVTGAGVESVDEFYAWAQKNAPRELTRATQELVGQRKTTVWKDLARSYKTKVSGPATVEHYKRAGVAASVDRATGDVLVQINGNWVSVKDLAK
jgi:hypothetical protein